MIEKKEFKTNINCASCVARVTPTLDQLVGKDHWKVDTTNEHKLLQLDDTDIGDEQVLEAIRSIGFTIEKL